MRRISDNAKNIAKSLKHCPWAIEQMIILFDNQLRLLEATKSTLEFLKQTQIYMVDSEQLHPNKLRFVSKIWHDPVWSKVIATAVVAIAMVFGGYFLEPKSEIKTPDKTVIPAEVNRSSQNNNIKSGNSGNSSININRPNNVTIMQNVRPEIDNLPGDRTVERERLRKQEETLQQKIDEISKDITGFYNEIAKFEQPCSEYKVGRNFYFASSSDCENHSKAKYQLETLKQDLAYYRDQLRQLRENTSAGSR